MGALGPMMHGQHKNKARRGNLGSQRPVFGHYDRGNFPGHDVVAFYARMVKERGAPGKCPRILVIGMFLNKKNPETGYIESGLTDPQQTTQRPKRMFGVRTFKLIMDMMCV